jgi:carbonic anhydrase
LTFNYRTSELHELNNGHTVQVSHKSGCHVALNNLTYNLRQFHFHEPSEHHIDGKTFPMEMHFVHQNEAGEILVMAVLMEVGPEPPALKNI